MTFADLMGLGRVEWQATLAELPNGNRTIAGPVSSPAGALPAAAEFRLEQTPPNTIMLCDLPPPPEAQR